MKLCILSMGAVVMLLGMVSGSAKGAVQTKDITLKSGDEEIKAFLAVPEGKGPFPAVVVIQEWWGLNDWIKDNAKRLAEKGYVALAPDLYRGKVTDDAKVAKQLLTGLPQDRAVRDLKAAAGTLAKMDNVDKTKIGSIGWCMGGALSLQLALNDPDIKACVICYGRVVTDADKLKPLHAAVLGVFGEKDMGIPPKDVNAFEKALKEAGKQADKITIFKDAGHGFMRAKNGDNANPVYNADAAKQAWQDIDQFFAKRLGGGK
jgi:carboxymethylenebutenolidase